MIEITTAVVEKVQTLMHDNAGFIMSKNVERILDDLAKQAEILCCASATIPVTMKMTISVDDGGVHLTFDSVTWQKTMRATDKACYTVDYDPRQPNLPGFDQADQPEQPEKQQPVIDVKALPEHEDDDTDDDFKEIDMKIFLTTCQAGLNLMDVCKHNIETIADANSITVLEPSPCGDSRVMSYTAGSWKMHVVPDVKEALEAADDGEHIVFNIDGRMTPSTMEQLKKNGYGILSVESDGNVRVLSFMPSGCWRVEAVMTNDQDGHRKLLDYLLEELTNDDCLLMDCVFFYGLNQ